MCDDCGCALGAIVGPSAGSESKALSHAAATPEHGDGRRQVAELSRRLLAANDRDARHNREHLGDHGVLAINVMSSPGSGKTSLLEATIDALRDEARIAVIEGDLETENDAVRIRAKGVPAVQITTGSACHLDAAMVHRALHELDLDAIDLLFIENVGNLVCPASFDLGQHACVVLLSVTEGDDKPAKYPVIFRGADLVLLTKIDLLEAIGDFDTARATRAIRELASGAPVAEVSVRAPGALEPWLDWLRSELSVQRAARGPRV
jgi:hydrogenase nickel incorporation protein HypB